MSMRVVIREPYESFSIPLSIAVLCPDCACISLSRNGRCSICRTEALSLIRVLDRPGNGKKAEWPWLCNELTKKNREGSSSAE